MTCSPDRTSDNSYGFKMKVFEYVRLCIGTIIPDNISIVKKWKNKRFITPICVASTSVRVISQTPWNTAWGLLRSWHDVPVLFQIPAWQAQTDTAVSLLVCISFVFGTRVGHFAATPQSDVVGIWSRDLGVMATLSVRQKMPFFVHL